ncbi:ribosome-associated translation inhibitor RaiA [candidate division KSB1 bacterium]|nr:ribosome-associated translation inhibitor RaiA [candidate division KSB1 bacterium]TDI86860.1 MAG: ribosome-associated translation inhibitor RaiA [Caldithrix sp.]TDI99171.1 MAG: ribosome-associated translation inhibitor RaiA [Caldithrix sp.]
MRVNITARHYKAPDKLKEYAEKEVRKLSKYFDGIIECEIVLDYEKTIQVVEIAMKVQKQKLFAREKSKDIYKGIDNAVDKIERQLKKYKEKLKDHSHTRVDSFDESSQESPE